MKWLETITAKKVHTGPGMYMLAAEALVGSDTSPVTAVHVSVWDDGSDKTYAVSENSIFDKNLPPQMIDQRDDDGKDDSEYSQVFDLLISVIKALDADIE